MSSTLYVYGTRELVTLPEAVALCTPQIACNNDAIAFLYTPKEFCLVKLHLDGKLFNSKGELSKKCLDSVYEARIFSPSLELRWLHKENSKGQVVLISEGTIEWQYNEVIETEKIGFIDTTEQRYLLWGKGMKDNIDPQWSNIATSRIGVLSIPVPQVQDQQHVQLVTKEYLQEEKGHGNVVVIEERLIGLVAGNEK